MTPIHFLTSLNVLHNHKLQCRLSHVLVFIAFFALSSYTADASGMAFGSLVLCSKFNGKLITKQGEPVAGVKVTRKWHWSWNDKRGSSQTITDEQGNFVFDEVTGSSITARLLPHEPGIVTEIFAQSDDGELLLFSVDKSNYEAGSELDVVGLDGDELTLHCRIDKKPDGEGLFWGTCDLPGKL